MWSKRFCQNCFDHIKENVIFAVNNCGVVRCKVRINVEYIKGNS